ncbi:MAG: hypothetical protein KI792_11935 [Alphaproteobacteria bacterium]|nr:hypothetical protein [Alphaproteobacteria bacterium SS10]
MSTALPSGPRRDDRTEIGPAEGLWEWAKRRPGLAGAAVGFFAGGVGAVPGFIVGSLAPSFSKDLRVMRDTARAHYHDRQANRFSEMGNERQAVNANKQGDKYRRRLARM